MSEGKDTVSIADKLAEDFEQYLRNPRTKKTTTQGDVAEEIERETSKLVQEEAHGYMDPIPFPKEFNHAIPSYESIFSDEYFSQLKEKGVPPSSAPLFLLQGYARQEASEIDMQRHLFEAEHTDWEKQQVMAVKAYKFFEKETKSQDNVTISLITNKQDEIVDCVEGKVEVDEEMQAIRRVYNRNTIQDELSDSLYFELQSDMLKKIGDTALEMAVGNPVSHNDYETVLQYLDQRLDRWHAMQESGTDEEKQSAKTNREYFMEILATVATFDKTAEKPQESEQSLEMRAQTNEVLLQAEKFKFDVPPEETYKRTAKTKHSRSRGQAPRNTKNNQHPPSGNK